jgi:hypothetical protein
MNNWKAIDPEIAFFPVELRPLFMEPVSSSNNYTRLKRHFAVVDLEKDYPFSVVTDGYRLITNKQAYDMASDVMRQVFNATSMDDMVCMKITMPNTRSFCHIDLIHKTADFSPWEKDKWSAFLRITNSYNRTRRLRFEVGFCRWICQNGMIMGRKSIEFSYAHTRRGMDRVNRFIENIGDIRKLEVELTEKLHQLQRYYVPESKMLAILCKAFGIKISEDVSGKPKRVQELIAFRDQTKELTKSYFSEMGPHGYTALSVLTDYASRPKGVIAPEMRINSLQQRCGSWMEEFVIAIQQPDFSYDQYLNGYQCTVEVIEKL